MSQPVDPRRAGMSREEKARLFERLRASKGLPVGSAGSDRAVGEAPIPHLAVRPDPLPLSFAQQRLWFLDRLRPGDPSYNVPAVLEIGGELHPGALRQALRELADRHEALRTTFVEIAERPAQRVAPHLAVPLPLVDLGALPEPARDAETERLVHAEVVRPFDLGTGPLLRALLLRLEAERYVAVLNLHHIVCDGWSMGVLVREMATLYQAAAAGTPAALPPLPIQYADFAVWQRQWLQGERLSRQLAFWRRRLAGVEPLRLPTDRPRPPRRGSAGFARPLAVGPEEAQRLQALALEERATPFIVLLAAWQALLGRLAGQDDVAVGTPVANRTRSETAGLIGFFVNTLVLRGDLADDPTFRELVVRLRAVALEAFAYQDLPFERLVEEMRLERDPSRTPLFQALLVLQNTPASTLAAGGLEIRDVPFLTTTAKFDLSLSLAESSDGRGLQGGLEASAELFDGPTGTRFARAFEILLAAALAGPDRRLSDLPLLAPGERHQLVVEWNPAPDPALSLREPIHRRFEAQVDRAPGAPAVTAGGETLTYGELDARANRLARHLLASGVRPGDLVALRFARSAELVVALLAVLKAGAGYLPLDPTYPAERLAFALEDSGASLLLTRETLEAAATAIAAQSPERPSRQSTPADPELPAYVIYTSGSTGRPKGVVIPHGHVTRLFTATQPWFDFGPADVWTLFHSYAFDFSVWEIWGALLHGGRLVVVPHELARSPEAFYSLLRDERVTVLNQTPSAFRQLLWAEEAVLAGTAPDLSLRLVIFGGEALEPAALAPWFDRHGDERPRLVNMYGITETTVHVTYRPLRRDDTARGSVFGVPIPDLTVHVVDRNLEPQPIGVPGEIAVGGEGVATGYLGRPELTAARFVPDPFGCLGCPGARLYRSGDLARRLPDGDLEYLGRIDFQVKVRGHRIELGEIEAALARHPAVREAAVGPRPGPLGETRLVAWIAAGPEGDLGKTPSLSELRAFLAATLPEPMLPSALVVLDRLPLTRNGKVDRRALPEPRVAPAPADLAIEPPAPGLESLVASLFHGVLQLPAGRSVGRHEDFFTLGGSSLTGAVLVNRLQKALGEEVPVALIFDAPTPAALAVRLAERSSRSPRSPREAGELRADAAPGPAPLSFPQERLWFLDRLTPGTAIYNIPGPLRLRGPLDVAALSGAFDEIRRRHAVLRTRFVDQDGTGVQIVDPWQPQQLPVVDLSALPEPARHGAAVWLTAEESAWPFDLDHGPLLRTLLLRLGDKEHVLLQTVHHIVSDGWSVRVMQQELTTLYAAFAADLSSPLPELPVQYADYARWQRQWLTEEETARQIAYWRERLGDDPPPLDLPLDRPRPPLQTFRGASVRRLLPADLADGLRRLAAGARGSLFMALLAGFDLLLSRLSGQDDVLVGTPVAGRTHADLEGLIGCFLNTLVLRADLSGNPTFRDLLGRVRDAAVGAYAHQEVPFEKLLAELSPRRDLSHTPFFQVFFNLGNFPDLGTSLPGGLTVELLAGAEADSKFDLTVYAAEVTEGVSLDLVYNADLFDAPRMEEMLRQYAAILAQAVAEPGASLDRFSLLTPEAAALLPAPTAPLDDAWAGAVPELFAEQARRHPERPAVEDDEGTWTYGELAAAVKRLAAELRAAGVEKGDRVAIWAHRSAPLALAVLGVLEAGAAFVMLDPAYPAPRIVDMLDLARPRAWVALAAAGPVSPEVEAFLDATGVACRIVLSLQSLESLPSLSSLPPLTLTPDDLAYVAFTSGSTGKPKGILGRHGPLTHFLPWMSERFGLGGSDRFSVLSGLAHDPLHRDLFTPLCLGGTVCFPSAGDIGTPGRLAVWMARRGITVANLTPAMGQILTEPPGGGAGLTAIPSLRWAMLVGDVLTRLDADRIRRIAPRATVVNLYGSTETQRAVSFHMAAGTAGGSRQVLPLGRGMKDVQLLVLRAENLAGIGEVGEICLRSPHLAAGYLGDPELTREQFQTNPFTGLPGDRIYRTGDLGRYLPDGEAAFAGRRDQQVKIRGFRVELGEIEAALGRLPGVREAVVVAREDDPGDRRLVAYVVPEGGVAIDVADLREALRAALPAYMVPAAFVLLDRLPLTPNNKVDRRALPAPEAAGSDRPFAAPATATERALAEVWAAVLRRERVGRHDDFFALGGHSLLAVQVVSRLRDRLGIEVSLQALFEASTVADLAGRIDSINHKPDEENERILHRDPRGETAGPQPLSFTQERLWFLDQLTPGTAIYNIPGPLSLRGPLDVAALARAFDEIRRRHAVLRTRFAEQGGIGVQIVDPWHPRPLPVVDLSALPEAARRGEAGRLTAEETAWPFDLGRGPLLRTLLLRLAGEEHVLLETLHHIVSDGWSVRVLQNELTALYPAFAAGRPSPLPELPVQYTDFARWQRQWLTAEETARQIAYWRERLGDDPPPLDLPLDRPRPPLQTFRGARVRRLLPADVADGLRRLAAGSRGSLFMALLAGFDLLLSRLAGQEDVLVGTPVAGRVEADLEGLIGCFLNTLVLRTDLAGNPTFRDLLGRVRDTAVGAYVHQEVPFEKLLEEIRPQRDLSRTPLFQVFFNLGNFPDLGTSLPGGLTVELLAGAEADSKFDLTVYAVEVPEGVFLDLVYNADLFDAPRMEEMLRQYAAVLAQAVADPDAPLDRFSLLTPEAAALLPAPTAPQDNTWVGTVQDLFAREARRHPERPAVEDDETTWTYGELAAAVNRLAAELRNSGVKKGDRVAIWAHRSAPLALAVLGVLEAGAAFMILDPVYPTPQILDRLDLASPRAWVALPAAGPVPAEVEAFLAATGVSSLPVSLLSRGGGWEGAGEEGRGGEGLTPDDLAYVAFTSGSTGKPKGILGRHGSLTHFLPWLRERFGLSEDDRHTMLSGLSHDPLQRDLFTSLCLGGTLCVPGPEEIGTPGRLAAWMARRGITFTNLTPAMAQILTEPPGGGAGLAAIPTLRLAMLVGDVLTRLDADRIRRIAPSATVVNLYGSTETVRALGYHVVSEVDGHGRQILPLGRGMEDTQLLVLSAGSARLAGIGEVGEICVRSPHLAAGYLGDPELTRERFQTNPFTGQPGDLVYRTGDLGRYLPDGEVAFAGRRDQQVKIRGFRVELGEIEAALGRLPGVREAVVVAREDDPAGRRLVAYVVPETAIDIADIADIADLREALRAALPSYMVPAAFVLLDRLPLTPNHKVDRRALPAPEAAGSDRLSEPPVTATEKTLGEIWAAVLRIERVGRHDDFFAIGGHSLLATQLVARIRDTFHVELPILAIFQAPTLEGMADRIDTAATGAAVPTVPALQPRRRERSAAEPRVFPLSLSQRGIWFLDQLEPASPTYVLATALRLTGRLDPAALAAALDEVVRRHESLRATFTVIDGEPVQVIAPALAIPSPVVDLAALPPSRREAELLALSAAVARRPFDLARGPLLRATLLRLGELENAVLVTLHHIVTDAWSMAVLVGEVSTLYAAFTAGRPSPLADLPLQFPDYAEWQRDQLQGKALDAQLAYWQDRLAGAPALDLPTDRPRRAVQRPQVAKLPLSAPPGLSERLRALAQGRGATPFMVLLAAFEVLLGRYAGQDDLVVGTPVANRRYSDLEKLIGLFVNTLALRGDLSGDPAFSTLLARVRAATLEGWAYQDLPLEKLVAELRLERDLSRAPLFQVLFQVQNAPPPEIALAADLTLVRMPLGTPQAGDYDMVVSFAETPGGLSGEWIYNTDLFDQTTIERMAGHFLHLLDAACTDPALRLSELPLADETELSQLLAWGRPEPLPEIPGDTELRRLFEIHAARDPEHPALAWDGGVLSYGDLNARANRWAWLLRSQGVGPETRVALAVERSPEMITGLLAVLKAGGAWVPLDPAWPVERLAFMVEDSGAALLLTQRHLAGQIAVPIPVLLLDGAPDPAAGWSEENPIEGTGPDQAAYVIYTSGSTGRPKGVVAINSGLAVFARSMADVLHATPADRYLQFPSFSFDASLVSIAATVATGATLVLHPRVTELSFAELRAFCAAQRVTLVDQPAAFFREIVGQHAASGKPGRLFGDAPLRALDTGGESLSREILHQWARLESPSLPAEGGEAGREGLGSEGTLFLDSYGPTEATVATAIYTATAREASRMERATIPLGRPLPGVEVYLLDEALRLVPLGVPGDLYVGGVGLTRGYLHRPDLTAEAFLPHPLSSRPGSRLYRTGDRARWLPDGTLEFLGRRDAQVKIRGFRVELEEIESALLRHPAVAQAAVLLLEGDRLAAYVVPAPDAPVEVNDLTPILRDHLRATLPDPMVPAAFVTLDRLPRTPGGKLDRRNLPRPEIARPAARDLVPPRDGVEQAIADLWQRLLSLETVGVHDNFFELGGHSLLGTRVIVALREEFGVDVPLRALFEKPTIADLALAVAQARVEQSASSEVDALLDSLEDLTDEEVEALLAAQAGEGDLSA